MKKYRTRKMIVSNDDHELPAEIRAEIEQVEEYRVLYRQTVYTRRLIALKRYEMPEADARERCVDTVCRRIERLKAQEEHRREKEASLSGGPALRYAAAAAAAFLAVHAYTINHIPSLNSRLAPASMLQTRSFGEFLLATNTNPVFPRFRNPFELTPTLPDGYGRKPNDAVLVRRTNGNERLIFIEE